MPTTWAVEQRKVAENLPYRAVSGTVTLDDADQVVMVANNENTVITLPILPGNRPGRLIYIAKENDDAYTVEIKTGESGDKIDGVDRSFTGLKLLGYQDGVVLCAMGNNNWMTVPSRQEVDSVFGDGSDSTVTISVNTTLTRDMYYDSLTVNSGIELKTANFRVFVRKRLVNNGTISSDGPAAANNQTGTGATAVTQGTLQGGTNGGNGGSNGANGSAGSNRTDTESGYGGSGGSGGGGFNGGSGGTATAPAAGAGSLRHAMAAVNGWTVTPAGSIVNFGGGAGGGGGGGNSGVNAGSGGGGGAGGGFLMIAARSLVNAGTIRANGGAGGNGYNAGFDGGGGGGGGGGTCILVYRHLKSNTEEANGGAGGIKQGAGVDGDAGGAGRMLKLEV